MEEVAMPIQKEKIIELKSLDIYELHYFNEIIKHIFKGRTEIEEYNFKKKKSGGRTLLPVYIRP